MPPAVRMRRAGESDALLPLHLREEVNAASAAADSSSALACTLAAQQRAAEAVEATGSFLAGLTLDGLGDSDSEGELPPMSDLDLLADFELTA